MLFGSFQRYGTRNAMRQVTATIFMFNREKQSNAKVVVRKKCFYSGMNQSNSRAKLKDRGRREKEGHRPRGYQTDRESSYVCKPHVLWWRMALKHTQKLTITNQIVPDRHCFQLTPTLDRGVRRERIQICRTMGKREIPNNCLSQPLRALNDKYGTDTGRLFIKESKRVTHHLWLVL